MLSVLSKFVLLVSLLVYEPGRSGLTGHASKDYTVKTEKDRKKKKNLSATFSDFLICFTSAE